MDAISIVITGHVDHGKSTLIGRLLCDTGSLPPDKLAEFRAASRNLGHEDEFAYIVDQLREERERAMTVDTAQVFFRTPKRRYRIIDTPGHREFLKNMLTGASQADAALLIVDAQEGVREQTLRHCHALKLLGMGRVMALVNKMDLVGCSAARFEELRQAICASLERLGVNAQPVLPISAREGENVVRRSAKLAWYDGPTVLQALDALEIAPAEDKPLRFPVQDVYDVGGPLAAGRVEAGRLRCGDELTLLPAGCAIRVLSIEKYLQGQIREAPPGDCVGLRLDQEVHPGDVLAGPPLPSATRQVRGSVFWTDADAYEQGQPILLRCATQEARGAIARILRKYDPASMETVEQDAARIAQGEAAEVGIALDRPVVLDPFERVPEMGRFVIERDGRPVAAGVVLACNATGGDP